MDLGLAQLTNDQYLDLLEAVLENGIARSGVVRELAQGLISDSGQKHQAIVAALESEHQTAVQKYQVEITRQVRTEMEAELAAGELRLIEPAVEARLVAEATIECMLELIDRALRNIDNDPDNFFLEISPDYIAVQYGGQVLERRHRLHPQQVESLKQVLRAIAAA